MLGSATERMQGTAGLEGANIKSQHLIMLSWRSRNVHKVSAFPLAALRASAVQGAAHVTPKRSGFDRRVRSAAVDLTGAPSSCSSASDNELPVPLTPTRSWRDSSSSSTDISLDRPLANRLHLKTANSDRQSLHSSQLDSHAMPMSALAGTSSGQSKLASKQHNSSPKLNSNTGSRWSFEELSDYSSTSNQGLSDGSSQCKAADPRILLAQQLQQIILPSRQFNEEASSVVQQAVLIAAAAAAALPGDKQPCSNSQPANAQHSAAVSNVHSSSRSPSTAAEYTVVVSEQHLLLALLHHSPPALNHVLNNTAAVPKSLAAAQNTVVQRVAAAAATAAAKYVDCEVATDWQQQQQQQAATEQSTCSLALTPGFLRALSDARNVARQSGDCVSAPHLLHALCELPTAAAAADLFQEALGAAVITADLRSQLEHEMCYTTSQIFSQGCDKDSSSDSSSSSSRNGSGSSSDNRSRLGCVCRSGPGVICNCEYNARSHINNEVLSWRHTPITSCSNDSSSSSSIGSSGDSSFFNRRNTLGSSKGQQTLGLIRNNTNTVSSSSSGSSSCGSSHSGSSRSSLLSRLSWIDHTLDSILTAAEQKDPSTAVATLTNTIIRLAQQQQQHRPDQQWLAAAWSIVHQRLNTYLSLNCYLQCDITDKASTVTGLSNVQPAGEVTDSIDDSIIAAAHAEAVSLLTGVAAAAAVSLRTWRFQTPDLQITLDLVMSHLQQMDGSDSWQLNGCNITDLYLPIMVQMLPLTAQGSTWQQQQQQQRWQQEYMNGAQPTAVCAVVAMSRQHSIVFGNFVRCINRMQPDVVRLMLSSSCCQQAVADALLLMVQQEQTNSAAAAAAAADTDERNSSSSGGVRCTVCMAFMQSLASALMTTSSSSSSSSGYQSGSSSLGSWRGRYFRTGSSKHKQQQQQQRMQPDTLVQLLAACQSLPQHFAAQPDVINAATDLTAGTWLSMAAAADNFTSEQLVQMLKSVRKNKHFLRYTAMAGATDSSSDLSKSLVAGTKHILHRLCTKQTLNPDEAAAALAVLDTPLWPAHVSQAAQSPLIQGLLNRVTDSIQDMSATQLEQLLSVAIRLPWCNLGHRLSEEWMYRVLAALVRVTADVAYKELDAATASTLAAALGDLCDLPVAASEQQMAELQEALPLLLPKLDQRHTSMVLTFVSRQAQMHTQTALVLR